MPISISPSGRVKLACWVVGRIVGEIPMPMVAVCSTTSSATAATCARVSPRSAAAPAALKAKKMPATPRRSVLRSRGWLATSSRPSTVIVSMSSSSARSAARSKLKTSPP